MVYCNLSGVLNMRIRGLRTSKVNGWVHVLPTFEFQVSGFIC